MSAVVGAALKKIAVSLVTDKKALKVIGGIILGVIIILVMPIAFVLGLFNGNVEIDTSRLHEIIEEKQSALMEVWTEVETAMTDAGYTSQQIQEAQVLFVFVLHGLVLCQEKVQVKCGLFAKSMESYSAVFCNHVFQIIQFG